MIHSWNWLFRSLVTAVVLGGVICNADETASVGLSAGTVTHFIVINELHVNPDLKTELVEFVELYNNAPFDVDLSGWSFTEGIFFTFPAGSKCPAGGYVLVAENPTQMEAKLAVMRSSVPSACLFGPYGGKLDNEGEKVVLCDAQGRLADEVDYRVGFPWPTVGDAVPAERPGSGPSL